MLISIVLELESKRDGVLPGELGRAGYAALLARLSELDAPLAAQIHAGNGPKPLTCSGLLGSHREQGNHSLRNGQRVAMRVTGLTPMIVQALREALLEQPPNGWELHEHPFRVVAAHCDGQSHPWSGQAEYEALVARAMTDVGRLARQVTLEFASPTSFKLAEGMHMPLPLPGLVFGSLVERWNAFSPVALSPELRPFCQNGLAISSFRLSSAVINHKEGSLRIGGRGRVTYRLLSDDPYWRAALNILADFALYSGVGIQTTMGMGQVRRV